MITPVNGGLEEVFKEMLVENKTDILTFLQNYIVCQLSLTDLERFGQSISNTIKNKEKSINFLKPEIKKEREVHNRKHCEKCKLRLPFDWKTKFCNECYKNEKVLVKVNKNITKSEETLVYGGKCGKCGISVSGTELCSSCENMDIELKKGMMSIDEFDTCSHCTKKCKIPVYKSINETICRKCWDNKRKVSIGNNSSIPNVKKSDISKKPNIKRIKNLDSGFNLPLEENFLSVESVVNENVKNKKIKNSLRYVKSTFTNWKKVESLKIFDDRTIYPNKCSDSWKNMCKDNFNELIEKGIFSKIDKDNVKSCFKVKFIEKKLDGKVREDKCRMVVDMGVLNRQKCLVKRLKPTYTKINDILDEISKNDFTFGVKWDIEDGYYNIEIPENEKNYLCICVDGEYYRYERLPQGHPNSCYIFDTTLKKLIRKIDSTFQYMDDGITLGKDKEECLEKYSVVKEKLSKHSFPINDLKTEKGSIIKMLNWEIDLHNKKVCIPNEKVNELIRITKSMSKWEFTTKGRLNSWFSRLSYYIKKNKPIEILKVKKICGNVNSWNTETVENPLYNDKNMETLLLKRLTKKWSFDECKDEMKSMVNRCIMCVDGSKDGFGVTITSGNKFINVLTLSQKWEENRFGYEDNNNDYEISALLEGIEVLRKLNKKRVLIYVDNDVVLSLLKGKESKSKSPLVSKVYQFISDNDINFIFEKRINKDKDPYLQMSDGLSRLKNVDKIKERMKNYFLSREWVKKVSFGDIKKKWFEDNLIIQIEDNKLVVENKNLSDENIKDSLKFDNVLLNDKNEIVSFKSLKQQLENRDNNRPKYENTKLIDTIGTLANRIRNTNSRFIVRKNK